MTNPFNPFRTEFSVFNSVDVQKDIDNNTYIVRVTFRKPEYFDEEVLKEQNLVYDVSKNNKNVTIANWKEGLQFFRAWMDYRFSSGNQNVVNAKIDFITNFNNQQEEKEFIVKNLVLSPSLNKAFQEIKAILAMDDPIYYRNKKNEVDENKVARFLMVLGLQTYTNNANITLVSTIANSIGKRIYTLMADDLNANLEEIRRRDAQIQVLWNYIFVILNQELRIMQLVFSDSNMNLSPVTKQKIQQIINNPFPNNEDIDHLFTGNEAMRDYVNHMYDELNNIDPKSINVQLEKSENVSASNSYANTPTYSQTHEIKKQEDEDDYESIDLDEENTYKDDVWNNEDEEDEEDLDDEEFEDEEDEYLDDEDEDENERDDNYEYDDEE